VEDVRLCHVRRGDVRWSRDAFKACALAPTTPPDDADELGGASSELFKHRMNGGVALGASGRCFVLSECAHKSEV
jgi:hypothetical protein